MKKIAPTLTRLMDDEWMERRDDTMEVWEKATAELRALLAVARAAKAWRAYYGACPPGTYQGKLYAALARLDKASALADAPKEGKSHG